MQSFPLNSKAKVSSIKQPKEITTYRRTEEGEWVYDSEGFSYFYFPDSYVDKSFDLTAGISKFNKIPEEQNVGDFPTILKALEGHEAKTGSKVECDIITFRGLLTKLLTVPILKEPFSFKIIIHNGTIMMKNDDAAELMRRAAEPVNDYQKKCEYSGYKFESLVTLPKPWSQCTRSQIESRHKKKVNNYEQLISVVKTGIGKSRIVLAGEMDAIFDYQEEGKSNLPHYIELKTNRTISTESHARTFEKKLYKTWAQCFLIGAKKIGVGFRDDHLYLKDVEIYETDEIPIMLKERINCMSSLKFFGGLMDWINSLDKTVNRSYTLTFEKGAQEVKLTESNEDFSNEFLGEEFKNWGTQ